MGYFINNITNNLILVVTVIVLAVTCAHPSPDFPSCLLLHIQLVTEVL